MEVLGQGRAIDRIRFRINSAEPVPVLIKISEFPNWRAYSEGKELHIYRASPYFMLIYARGEVELRYEDTWSDTLGKLLTLAGAAIAVFLFLRKK